MEDLAPSSPNQNIFNAVSLEATDPSSTPTPKSVSTLLRPPLSQVPLREHALGLTTNFSSSKMERFKPTVKVMTPAGRLPMVDATTPNPTVLPDDDPGVQFSLFTTSLRPPPDDVNKLVRLLHPPPDRGKDSAYYSAVETGRPIGRVCFLATHIGKRCFLLILA